MSKKYTTKHVTIQLQAGKDVVSMDRLRLYRFDVLWGSCFIGDSCSIISEPVSINLDTEDTLDDWEF